MLSFVKLVLHSKLQQDRREEPLIAQMLRGSSNFPESVIQLQSLTVTSPCKGQN